MDSKEREAFADTAGAANANYRRMSTASLPSYHFEPQDTEQRLAHRLHIHRPQGNFIKNSRTGGIVLRLANQHDDASLPEYGRSASVEGNVELKNGEGIQSVEVKVCYQSNPSTAAFNEMRRSKVRFG